jgi:hypothetical protein
MVAAHKPQPVVSAAEVIGSSRLDGLQNKICTGQ